MNIHRPTRAPQPPPLISDSEAIYSVSPSESTWRDYEIRRGMDIALQQSPDDVQEISKLIQEAGLTPLRSVQIAHPYAQPPVVYTPGCMSQVQESDNVRLKDFAFDAYDSLRDYFGDTRWAHWFIAPFYDSGDDTHETYSLGVFVDE